MKRKIVVLYTRPEDKEALVEIFNDWVLKGVEIYFCDKKEAALSLIEKEHPHLLLIDATFLSAWPGSSIPTLPLIEKKEKGEGLFKPFHAHQVLEKCLPHIDLAHLEAPQPLPM